MSEKAERTRKKHNTITFVVEIFLCIICLLAITAALYFAFKYNSEKLAKNEVQLKLDQYTDPLNPYVSSSEIESEIKEAKQQSYDDGYTTGTTEFREKIRDVLLSSNSSLETIKSIFPNDIVVIDSSKYYLFPINNNLERHNFDMSAFGTQENGRITYNSDRYDTEIGIDVSKYQGKIDWEKVAKDDIDFAIIRMGIRGYSKGDLIDDDTFEYNIENALKNGIGVGVYFFTQAVSEAEAIEEANYVLDKLEPYNVTYPIIIDVETVGGDEGRGNSLNMSDRTDYTIIFCDAIKRAGYTPMIYGNLKTFLLMLDMERLEDYPKWFAGYTDTPYFPYKFDMWQFTEKAVVSGIDEPLDMNLLFIEK